MSFGEDDEILQDFLVEAGEILDQLSEQLVDLEQRPDDKDLLNAIFRGFHTVKGGAGFLQLDAMVECCHVTENLFDILRNGERSVTPELMDVVLQALDTVNSQFQQVSKRETPEPAKPELIDHLSRLVSGGDQEGDADLEAASKSVIQPVVPNVGSSADSAEKLNITDDEFEGFLDALDNAQSENEQTENAGNASDEPEDRSVAQADDFIDDSREPMDSGGDEISEEEFENLLDKLHGAGKGPGTTQAESAAVVATQAAKPAEPSKSANDSDEISEDEFESLLDQLHGQGKAPGSGDSMPAAQAAPAPKKEAPKAPPKFDSGNSDLITDDEFESLLDQLHGSGKGPSSADEGGDRHPPPPRPPAPATPPPAEHTRPQSSPQPSAKPEPAPAAPIKAEPVVALANKKEGAANTAMQASETTVRVDTQRLDDIMNMVGELVLVRNRLVRLGLDSADESLSKAVANLDVVTGDLQTAVMKTRMQPIKKVFGRFPRVVRDLARNLKKEINLELVGEDTDLDKNLVEALADPLVHLVRNSVDHGIELPAARESVGKSRVGRVVLSAEQEGDHILLSISDDGAGMDPDKLRQKAVEKGLYDQDSAARLSDVEAYNLIFSPGFSTKTEISDVSGRGVGMDVVKTKITQLNGSIEIVSRKGEGTRFAIKVPLTLAIMPTLMVMLAKQCFALPLVSVNEIFQLDLSKTHVVDGQECVTIRDKAIPIFHLKRWLVNSYFGEESHTEAHVVIVSVGTRKVGFVVDQLIGQEEVVIKPLGKMLQGTPGMAGATITGDGTIALILDVPSLLKRYAGGI